MWLGIAVKPKDPEQTGILKTGESPVLYLDPPETLRSFGEKHNHADLTQL